MRKQPRPTAVQPDNAAYYAEEPDFDSVDLASIEIDADRIDSEYARSSGMDVQTKKFGEWWSSHIGVQKIQILPLAYVEHGQTKFDWSMVHHVHTCGRDEGDAKFGRKAFIEDNAPDLLRKIREELPGFHVVSKVATFGDKNDPISQLKWDIGKWYAENTPEGWKHPDMKRFGVYPRLRVMACVYVRDHAGAFLQTPQGERWIRREEKQMRSSKMKDLLKKFQKAIVDTSTEYENFLEFKETKGELYSFQLAVFSTELYSNLVTAVTQMPDGGKIINPRAGALCELTTFLNPANGYRDTKVRFTGETMPIAKKKSEIRDVLRSIPNLFKYRTYMTPELETAINERCEQIRREVFDGEGSNIDSEYELEVDRVVKKARQKPATVRYEDIQDDDVAASFGVQENVQPEAEVDDWQDPADEAEYAEDPEELEDESEVEYEDEEEDSEELYDEDDEVEYEDEDSEDLEDDGVAEPTTELNSEGYPKCFRCGLYSDDNEVCNACAFEIDCIEDD